MNEFTGAVLLLKWMLAAGVVAPVVVRGVGAILERELEVWQALLTIGLGLSLTIAAIALALTPWYWPLLLLIVFVDVAIYMGQRLEDRARARRMAGEDIARYREAIEFDDKNAAAHAYLARVYRKQGRLAEAVTEFERAIELDANDAEARRDLKALVAEIQAVEAPPVCPRCQSPLDESGKTCPECGWSRSTAKGLRDVYSSGAVKQGLIWGIVVSTALGVVLTLLRVSIEFTLTLLIVGWIVGFFFLMRWILHQDL